ncbi:MAG: hypothetical protein WA624_08110 [Methylocella sp.]
MSMESGEILTSDTPQPVCGMKRGKGRSRVTNGSKLLPLSDGRSATARRFRDLYEDIAADLGGKDHLSEGQRQLVRRAAMLSAECERMEAMAARNDRRPDGAIAWKSEAPFVFDLEIYGQLCDRLGRLFGRLGLERQSRDVTPTLQSYLQAKAAP